MTTIETVKQNLIEKIDHEISLIDAKTGPLDSVPSYQDDLTISETIKNLVRCLNELR